MSLFDPPDLPPAEGAVAAGSSGRPPRPDDELEAEGAERARIDRADAARRRDAALARAGGGPGDDSRPPEELEIDADAPALSILHHLDELRTRILRSVGAILLGAGVGWWFSGTALEWTIHRTVGTVVVLDPIESFSERFKLALVLGACVALPLVLYQAWAFVLPGLFRRERRLLLPHGRHLADPVLQRRRPGGLRGRAAGARRAQGLPHAVDAAADSAFEPARFRL